MELKRLLFAFIVLILFIILNGCANQPEPEAHFQCDIQTEKELNKLKVGDIISWPESNIPLSITVLLENGEVSVYESGDFYSATFSLNQYNSDTGDWCYYFQIDVNEHDTITNIYKSNIDEEEVEIEEEPINEEEVEIEEEPILNRSYCGDGSIKLDVYILNNQKHKIDGPALINYWCTSGVIDSEKWYINDLLHRTDGPARIQYDYKGHIKSEEYYIEGKTHRTDGPAVIEYCENGNIIQEAYYVDDLTHRTDGPARIFYNYYGEITGEEYYIEGVQLTKKEFLILQENN